VIVLAGLSLAALTSLFLLPGFTVAVAGVLGFALFSAAVAILVAVQIARDAAAWVVVRERGIEWRRGRDHGSAAFSAIVGVDTFGFSVMRGRQISGIRIVVRSGVVVRLPGSLTELDALLASLHGKVPPSALPKAVARVPRKRPPGAVRDRGA